jgi:pyruvate-formate lyase
MIKKRDDLQFALYFTQVYRDNRDRHIALREAECLRAQFPAILSDIREADLFAGRIEYPAVGFSPQLGGLGFYCDEEKIRRELEKKSLDPEHMQRVEEMLAFWKQENTTAKVRAAYPAALATALPSDIWTGEPGVAFPLYRMGGAYVDFDKLVTIGIPGLHAEVSEKRNRALQTGGDIPLFDGMLAVLDVLAEVCRYYAKQAAELVQSTSDSIRKQELLSITAALEAIIGGKPQNLREAIQLSWLYTLLCGVLEYGRMDVYLGDFYARDVDAGRISEEQALTMVQALWRLIDEPKTIYDCRVVIGGRGRRNEENADRFALLAMEATRTVKEALPQLTLRFYNGMNPLLMEKALSVIGEGRTFPMLYNDDVNIPAVRKAFDVPLEEAEQYVPFGCGEYVLNHRSFGTPSSVINLLKALEITLHNGRDPFTGNIAGLQLGEFSSFTNFDELFEAYKKQMEYFIRAAADQEELEYKITGECAPFLYLSMLFDDCLETGKGIFTGGIRYLGGTTETYGNTNTANSLTAIREIVYEKKLLTPEKLLEALDANFEGYETERRLVKDCPKYGNDHDKADQMLLAVHNHVCNTVRSQRERTGLHSFLVVNINNSANTTLGKWTSASADGRLAGEPMANANNPSGGSDTSGVTAFLNSIAKPDPSIHAGMVQNMKFSRSMFSESRKKVELLLQTYFAKGGTQAMITVVSRDELEKAMVEPDQYRNVFVRVGGFSARFVELAPDVQKEVLSRTLY